MMSDVRKALKDFVKAQMAGFRLYVAKVAAVDQAGKTCDLQPLDDGPLIYAVRLKPDLGSDFGAYAIPKKGSYVLAVELGDENNVCILLVEKASKYVIMTDGGSIELNGNSFGMIKSSDLITQIKKLQETVDALLGIVNGPVINEAGNGNPSVLQAALKGAVISKTTGNFNNLINDKVKHG